MRTWPNSCSPKPEARSGANRWLSRLLPTTIAAGVLLSSTLARAEEADRAEEANRAEEAKPAAKDLYLPVGIALAGSFGRVPNSGFVLGAEASLAYHMGGLRWVGGYLDGLYDFGADEVRLSLGPEIGYAVAGVDAGYLLVVRRGDIQHGVVVRPMLTLGIVTAYVRFGMIFSQPDDRFGEAGALLKVPIAL